ncbi:putative gp61-like protein [Esparto virus]|uniref:Putative gp61-like protein n=1 Tax=Esparto virus TaxID=2072209 RepID=A0A2I7G2Y5_9VIRU|nr:putative gp61-like protein [Esparto virus]AUQ43993.1 putative gp61-like protein [Esparto virus]
MYNIQSNSARFIYTLSATRPDSKYKLKRIQPEIGNHHVNSILNDPQSKYIKDEDFPDDTLKRHDSIANVYLPTTSTTDTCTTTITKTSNITTIPTTNKCKSSENLANDTKISNNQNTPHLLPSTTASAIQISSNILRQPYCKLKNGFYLTKVARSDEKIRYTETDMYSMVRTVLFIHCYGITPMESLTQIINTGEITFECDDFPNQLRQNLTLGIAVQLLDMLFGDGFSTVVSRMVIKCMQEYNCVWRYYPYNSRITCPSALDFIKLARFINTSTFQYSKSTQFMLNNTCDHRIPLQNTIKRLR